MARMSDSVNWRVQHTVKSDMESRRRAGLSCQFENLHHQYNLDRTCASRSLLVRSNQPSRISLEILFSKRCRRRHPLPGIAGDAKGREVGTDLSAAGSARPVERSSCSADGPLPLAVGDLLLLASLVSSTLIRTQVMNQLHRRMAACSDAPAALLGMPNKRKRIKQSGAVFDPRLPLAL